MQYKRSSDKELAVCVRECSTECGKPYVAIGIHENALTVINGKDETYRLSKDIPLVELVKFLHIGIL
ncbi:MAG: hypothetical protein PHN69_03050 [Candidatus Pacebacteria bacterium]|nr:hypothetical protein [Candidatus Paceibacterota bacterium]